MSLKARRNDRDLGSRKSSGPAVIVPHQKAGHMTDADQIARNCKKALANRGRPHMTWMDACRLLPHHRRGLPEQQLALFFGADRRLAKIRIDLLGLGVGALCGGPLADGLEPAL